MLNQVTLIGRVGHNPEIRVSQSGKKVCRLSVATDAFRGGQRATDWHNVVCFEKVAENCERFVQKGSVVGVVGSIQYSEYTGKDGVKKTAANIIADRVQFISRPNGQTQAEGAQPSKNSDGTPTDAETFGAGSEEVSEIPF